MNTLLNSIEIQKGEGKKTFLFFLYYFCLIASIIIGKTARDVFFLSRFDLNFLPHILIISSASVIIMSLLFIHFSQNKNLISFALQTGSLFIFSLLIINSLMNKWTYAILYIWMDVIGAVLIPQFWLIANEKFTTRQAKRLFGPISGGAAIANIIIGFSIQSGFIVPIYLLPAAILFLILSLILIILINNNDDDDSSHQISLIKNEKDSNVSIFSALKNHRYLWLLSSIVIISSITITLIEYQFKMIASTTYNESQLTELFGMLYGIVGLASGFMQIFIMNKFLRKFGVIIGLLILPAFLGISSLLLTLSPIIIYALMARLSDLILRFSFHDTTMQIIWLPVTNKLKQTAKPFIDGTIKNLAQGFSGFLILSIIGFIGSNYINILILILIILWFFISILLKNGYLMELKNAIGKRSLNLESLHINITDPHLITLFKNTLMDGNENQKVFILQEIKKLSPNPWKNELNKMFYNSNNNIRQEIISIAETNSQILSDSTIISIIKLKDDPLISMGIILAAKRRINIAIPILEKLINNDNDNVRVFSKVALIILKNQLNHIAHEQLRYMLNDENKKIKYLTLKATSYFPRLLTIKELKKIIHSNDKNLQILAAEIIAKGKIEDLLSDLISNLNINIKYKLYKNIIKNFQPQKVEPLIIKQIIIKHNNNKTIPSTFIKMLGECGSEKSVEYFINLINKPHQDSIINLTLLSIQKITRRSEISKHCLKKIEQLLDYRIKQAYLLLNTIYSIQKNQNNTLFQNHFNVKLNHEIERVFIILDILYPDKLTSTYVLKLNSNNNNIVSNVLEVIDNQYPDNITKILMPLIDERSIKDKLKFGRKNIFSSNKLIDHIIIDMTKSQSLWEAAIAIDFIIDNKMFHLINKLNWVELIKNYFIEESVVKAFKSLEPSIQKTFNPFIKTLDIKKDTTMLTTLEKTIILKGVDIFSELTSEEIFQIAQIAQEKCFLSEEIIFKENDPGDSMFIIIDGKVSVYNQKKEITTLKERECFGEMALLNQELRSTSIRSISDTVTLKIDEENFYELVETNIKIIQGIVKILSKRLRESIKFH